MRAKHFILLHVLVFLITTCETVIAQGKRFGLKGSTGMSWVKPENDDLYKSDGPELGFGYGFLADFGFTQNYSFASGIEVNYKGGNLIYPEAHIYFTGTANDSLRTRLEYHNYTLQYIEVPLSIKMRSNPLGDVTLYLQFGFAPGFVFKSRADIDTVTYSGLTGIETRLNHGREKLTDQNNTSLVTPFSLSMLIGGGAEFSLGGSTVAFAGIHFNNGLIGFLDEEMTTYKKGASICNYLSLEMGLLF